MPGMFTITDLVKTDTVQITQPCHRDSPIGSIKCA